MLIMLTQGKLMEIDDEDFAYMSQWSWYAVKDPDMKRPEAQYCANAYDGFRKKRLYAHRLLLGVTDPKVFVDHKDGNTLNNRRDNLRVCTNAENQYNRKTAWGTVPYKGVVLHKNLKKRPYNSRIWLKGRFKSLGYYATPEEAARAYNVAALKYFGEFACLNVIAGEEN